MTNRCNIIILHDYFEALEGGGRLCSILANHLPAELGYGFARPQHPFLQSLTTAQHNLKAASQLPLWRQWRLARSFSEKTSFLNQYDTVIYSGFYTPLAIKHHLGQKNILYCHTPPRFIYDQQDFYLQQLSLFLRPLLINFINYLRPRYEQAVAQMDVIVANSENVRSRIQHYLQQEAIVIHPPCETQHFRWQGPGQYYLSTARLDPLKRVDKIVQAFLQMPDKKLIVASGGSQLKRLQKIANHANNIQFTGWISESRLRQLLGEAIATIYLPQQEDFGMSPVESMAAGKPVIAVAEGGLLETVVPEQTGILLPADFTEQTLIQAVRALTPSKAAKMRFACENRAQQFSSRLFLQKMQALI